MIWARMLAYITGTVDQELLLRNEYLAAENRILRAQIKGRLLLSDAEKATLAEIALRLGRKTLEELAAVAKLDDTRPHLGLMRNKRGKLKTEISNLATAIAEGHRSAALLDQLGSARGNSTISAKNFSRLTAGA